MTRRGNVPRTQSDCLLTAKEAAQRLGISDRKLRGLVYRGKLPRADFGAKCKRFDPRDLEAFVEEAKRKRR